MRYENVVVVGASLAGLFAAAASAGSGGKVTVVERDELPRTAEPRPGVPQGYQAHVLLYRGLLALEELLPGIQEQLRAAGAVAFDTGDLAWLAESGWAPHGIRQFPVVSATRPLLEHLVLDRVRQLPGVQVLDRKRVTSIGRGDDRWSVTTTTGALPWAIASAEDLRLPTSTGTQTVLQRMMGAWGRELGRLSAHGHERAQMSLARVYHLMASPRLLYHPALFAAALRARIRGYGPPAARPTVMSTLRR